MEGRCLLPSLPPCRGRTLFFWSTFSGLRGDGEAACWRAPQPPGSAALGKPPGRANALAHGHMLGVPFPGSRDLPAVAVLGSPGRGFPERWAGSSSAGLSAQRLEAAQPGREDSSPAPTAARASCNLSRAQPSREVPLLEKGL